MSKKISNQRLLSRHRVFSLWFFIRAKRNENRKNAKGQKTVVKKNGTDRKSLYKVAWGLYLLEIEFF